MGWLLDETIGCPGLTRFMYFGWNVKSSWFDVGLYKVLSRFVVYEFVLMHSVNVNSDTFLYVGSHIFV